MLETSFWSMSQLLTKFFTVCIVLSNANVIWLRIMCTGQSVIKFPFYWKSLNKSQEKHELWAFTMVSRINLIISIYFYDGLG